MANLRILGLAGRQSNGMIHSLQFSAGAPISGRTCAFIASRARPFPSPIVASGNPETSVEPSPFSRRAPKDPRPLKSTREHRC